MDLSSLSYSSLFQGISPDEYSKLLHCLSASTKFYHENETIFHAGISKPQIGILLKGKVQITKNDYWGNQAIISVLEVGDLFAEAFVYSNQNTIPVNVIAIGETEILFIHKNITHTCTKSCPFHILFIQNMLEALAQKTLLLTQRLEHNSQKTLKDKLLSYFGYLAQKQNSSTIILPLSRQELADYLACDRSALSRELSNLQKKKMIQYTKHTVTLMEEKR